MTYLEAYEKLEKCGQVHVLNYYHELEEAEKEELLTQIENTDFSVLQHCKKNKDAFKKGKIEPLQAMQLSEIESRKEEFKEIGLQTIRDGKVGAVLLAGGMGTRLGSDDPKGMYNIGINKELYIFECLIHNLLQVVEQSGTWVPLFIMTSDKNHNSTMNFLAEHQYFGYHKEEIFFFMQDMAPASDFNGTVYMESKSKISTSPNGNGGWFSSMEKAGILSIIHEKKVEWLNVFAVDNVLQRIADPVFVGATIAKNCVSGAKVVKKSTPTESVGVMCLEDGKPSIVEYYELTEAMMKAKDEAGEPAYNYGVILNYLFRESDLMAILQSELPLHVVEKKIPYLNEAGELIKPETANGYKFESLILDMIHQLDSCLPFEVERKKEFAPIKNKTGIDSVDSAVALLKENGIEV